MEICISRDAFLIAFQKHYFKILLIWKILFFNMTFNVVCCFHNFAHLASPQFFFGSIASFAGNLKTTHELWYFWWIEFLNSIYFMIKTCVFLSYENKIYLLAMLLLVINIYYWSLVYIYSPVFSEGISALEDYSMLS